MVLGRSIGAASIGDKRSAVIAFFGVPQRTDHSRSGRHTLSTLVYHLHGGLLWVTLERGRVVGIGTTSSYYRRARDRAAASGDGLQSRTKVAWVRCRRAFADTSDEWWSRSGSCVERVGLQPVRWGTRDDAGVSMSGATTRRLARHSAGVPRPIYRHVRHAYQTVANRAFSRAAARWPGSSRNSSHAATSSSTSAPTSATTRMFYSRSMPAWSRSSPTPCSPRPSGAATELPSRPWLSGVRAVLSTSTSASTRGIRRSPPAGSNKRRLVIAGPASALPSPLSLSKISPRGTARPTS